MKRLGTDSTLVRVVLAIFGLVIAYTLMRRMLPLGVGSLSAGGGSGHDAILDQPGSTHGH